MKIKIGLLGVGKMGKIHLRQLKEIPLFEIVGFYDPNKEVADEVAATFKVTAFPDMESLIAVCDAIDIISPTTTHFECAKAAILQGKHIFLEKPITHTLTEAEELISLIEKYKITAQVGHIERFNPAIVAIDDMEFNPMFIEVHRLGQMSDRGRNSPVVLELMIHDLDLLLKMVNSPVAKVFANGVCVINETHDIVNVRLEFENGCVANLTASRISMKVMRKLRIFQKDTYISIDFLEKQTEVVRLAKEGEVFEEGQRKVPIPVETHNGYKNFVLEMPKSEDKNAIRMELESFGSSILEGTPVAVNVYDGYEALKLAHLILENMK